MDMTRRNRVPGSVSMETPKAKRAEKARRERIVAEQRERDKPAVSADTPMLRREKEDVKEAVRLSTGFRIPFTDVHVGAYPKRLWDKMTWEERDEVLQRRQNAIETGASMAAGGLVRPVASRAATLENVLSGLKYGFDVRPSVALTSRQNVLGISTGGYIDHAEPVGARIFYKPDFVRNTSAYVGLDDIGSPTFKALLEKAAELRYTPEYIDPKILTKKAAREQADAFFRLPENLRALVYDSLPVDRSVGYFGDPLREILHMPDLLDARNQRNFLAGIYPAMSVRTGPGRPLDDLWRAAKSLDPSTPGTDRFTPELLSAAESIRRIVKGNTSSLSARAVTALNDALTKGDPETWKIAESAILGSHLGYPTAQKLLAETQRMRSAIIDTRFVSDRYLPRLYAELKPTGDVPFDPNIQKVVIEGVRPDLPKNRMSEVQKTVKLLDSHGVPYTTVPDRILSRVGGAVPEAPLSNAYRDVIETLETQQDTKGGDTRSDAKGGYEDRFAMSRNFLATDKVPDSIFGYPIASREEDYTPEDIKFFRAHPEAGGYYDLGEGSPEDGTEEGAPVQDDEPKPEMVFMDRNPTLFSHVKRYEKLELSPYEDIGGYAIGYGAHRDAGGAAVTAATPALQDEAAAAALLARDLYARREALKTALPNWDYIPGNGKQALLDIAMGRDDVLSADKSKGLRRDLKAAGRDPEKLLAAVKKHYYSYRKSERPEDQAGLEARRVAGGKAFFGEEFSYKGKKWDPEQGFVKEGGE